MKFYLLIISIYLCGVNFSQNQLNDLELVIPSELQSEISTFNLSKSSEFLFINNKISLMT